MKNGIQPEPATADTPQFNGAAKQHINTLKLRAMAMMNGANLKSFTQGLLWTEAICCANTMYNVSSNAVSKNIPF